MDLYKLKTVAALKIGKLIESARYKREEIAYMILKEYGLGSKVVNHIIDSEIMVGNAQEAGEDKILCPTKKALHDKEFSFYSKEELDNTQEDDDKPCTSDNPFKELL